MTATNVLNNPIAKTLIMKIKNYIFSSLAIVGALCMTSCNDDDTYDVVGNPDNLLYVTTTQVTPANLPQNSFVYQLYHTPVGTVVASEPGEIKLRVNSTRRVKHDTQIELEVSPETQVAGYAQLPASVNLDIVFSSNTVTIPEGENISDEITINVSADNVDWASLTEKAYLLPIQITEVSSGAVPSEDKGYAYIGVSTDVKDGMLNADSNTIPGTAISDRSAWTATYSVPATGAGGDCTRNLFDGSTRNYAYLIFNHADKTNEEVITTIDMGQVNTITGVQFYYFGWYYAIKDGTIETSLDGTEWTSQGTRTWDSLDPACNFAFWAPMQVRYIRLTSHSFYGGTGEGQVLAEFNAYAQ